MCVCLAAAETPLNDVVYAWDFSGPEGKDGKYNLIPNGACRLGVPAGFGKGECAEFSGGYLEVSVSDDMPIAVQGDFSMAFRVRLDAKYFDMENREDATLFEWYGNDMMAKPKRHSISLQVFNIGYLKHDRYLGIWVDHFCQHVSLKTLQPDRWHDVVFRVTNGMGELFVNGSIPAHSPAKKLTSRLHGNAIPADIIAENFCVMGNNFRKDLPFKGNMIQVAIWNRALSDQEIAVLSAVKSLDTVWRKPGDWRERWEGFYEEDINPEEAYRRIYEDYQAFYRRALKEDIYFPRFHLTLPGFMTEPSMLSYKGKEDGYHIFPHDCVHWVNLFGYFEHTWQHFSSEDLLNWRLMPYPGWPRATAGNMVEFDEVAVSFPNPELTDKGGVFEKWISTDGNLEQWRLEKKVEVPLAPNAKGITPKDNYIFLYEDEIWMLGGYAGWTRKNPSLKGKVELYRAIDRTLDHWSYVGEFYRGSGKSAHHPRLFFVDGKVIMDSDVPIDRDVWYLLGEIEDGKFIRQGGGDFHFDCGGYSWGQTITEPDGRVLRWTLIRNVSTENNLVSDHIRRGWGNVYSLPRVMGVKDLTLIQKPAPELAGLREQHLYHSESKSLEKGAVFFPKLSGNRAGIEVRCNLTVPESGIAGIVLKAKDDDKVRFFYDQKSSKLILAFDQSNNGGRSSSDGLGQNAQVFMDLNPGEKLDLNLFFDHSVIEVYAKGYCSAGRWYPESPRDIKIGLFSEQSGATFAEVDIWTMDTIWKEYN